jgi:hypothetical protein
MVRAIRRDREIGTDDGEIDLARIKRPGGCVRVARRHADQADQRAFHREDRIERGKDALVFAPSGPTATR